MRTSFPKSSALLPLSFFLIENGRFIIPHGRCIDYIVDVIADHSAGAVAAPWAAVFSQRENCDVVGGGPSNWTSSRPRRTVDRSAENFHQPAISVRPAQKLRPYRVLANSSERQIAKDCGLSLPRDSRGFPGRQGIFGPALTTTRSKVSQDRAVGQNHQQVTRK